MKKNNSPLPFTKIGDKGCTLLSDFSETRKTSERIIAIGDIDELNSTIGMANHSIQNIRREDYFFRGDFKEAKNKSKNISTILVEIQHLIFVAGSDCSSPMSVDTEYRIKEKHINKIESLIKKYHATLKPLEGFIIPDNHLHLCRSITRRAERSCWLVKDKEPFNENCIVFLNRLSDLFFTLARYLSKKDQLWNHIV